MTADAVQRLLDKDDIRELVALYVHRMLVSDWRGMADLFTEDGVLDYSQALAFVRLARAARARDPHTTLIYRGRAAIASYLPITEQLNVRAFFTNHVISVTGDTAVCISTFDNRLVQHGESVLGAGRMSDELRRVGGRWLFSYRRQELFFITGLAQGWADGSDRTEPAPLTSARGWEDELLRNGRS